MDNVMNKLECINEKALSNPNDFISECEEMKLVIPDKDVFIQAALQWGC